MIRRLFALTLLSLAAWAASAGGEHRPRLLAYYFFGDQTATPAYTASQIPYGKLTHLIHVALQPAPASDGSIVISQGAIEAELIPRAHAAGVRVIVSVQGPAAVFSKVAGDSKARSLFAQSLKDFVVQYRYDGVDIDWEVPTGPADVANCVAMMQAIRDALPRPEYLLSMATPSTPGHWGEYDFKSLTPIVDFFNVMTYDFHGPWTDHTGHNSPLFPSASDPGHEGSLDDTVSAYLNAFGVPPEKINLGMPFYGYEFPAAALSGSCKCEKTVTSRNYGSWIKQRIDHDGWVRHTDPIAMVPYLVHEADPPGFITYDDPESIARKVTYTLETRGLGGVFMWEISADFDGAGQDLMDAMYRSYLRAEKALAPAGQLPALYGQVSRVVWVVKDIDGVVRGWKSFGLSDIHDFGSVVIHERYRDREQTAAVHEVSGRLGALTVEFIRPGRTPDAFTDFLNRHGDGIFGIVHQVGDPETLAREVERMNRAGVHVLQEVTDGPAAFTWLDTEPRGKYALGLVCSPGAVAGTASAATISHFGLVVRDSKPVSDFWSSLGFPHLEIAHATPREDSRYRYAPLLLSFDVGWQRHTSLTYEWIIPPGKPANIYADFLKLHGEGIQHVGMPVPDLDAAIAHYAKLGYSVWQSGAWGNVGQKNSGRYAYMDTDRIGGVVVELIQTY